MGAAALAAALPPHDSSCNLSVARSKLSSVMLGGSWPETWPAPVRWVKMTEMSTNDFRATSWEQLNELLYAGSWNSALGRFRSSMAYRGVADQAYSLRTSLARLSPA